MEVLITIAVLILALVGILLLIGGLLWAEKGINEDNQRLSDQWDEENHVDKQPSDKEDLFR